MTNVTSAQFSTLVRKLSEVEGINPNHILRSMKTSIDEGVEVDYPDTGSSDSSHTHWTSDSQTSSVGRLSSSGSGSGVPSSGEACSSNYPSFENFSYCDPGWSQSLPSCQDGGNRREPTVDNKTPGVGVVTCRGGGVRYNPMVSQPTASYLQSERQVTRSPVNFREGRRSSDGLVAQGLVAFQQRLYDKEKAEEVVDLHQVREEARELAIKFGEEEDVEARETVKTSNYHRAGGGNKRTSLPENLAYTSSPRQVALQQQLLQHRLHQKRQNLQKQRLSHGEPLSGSRHRSIARQSSGKLYFHPAADVIPPGPDFHFQPIAEDEPGPDPSPHPSPAGHRVADNDPAWAGLPSYMAACRVTERSHVAPLGSPLPAQPSPLSPYHQPLHHAYTGPPNPLQQGPYQSSPTRELPGGYQGSPIREHLEAYPSSPSRENYGHYQEGPPR